MLSSHGVNRLTGKVGLWYFWYLWKHIYANKLPLKQRDSCSISDLKGFVMEWAWLLKNKNWNSIISTNVVGICRLKTCGFFHCCNVPVVFLVSCSFSTACWIFSFKLFNVSFLCRAVVTKIVFPIIKVYVNPKGW